MNKELDETYNDEGPECPYCKHVHDSANDPETYYETEYTDFQCKKCNKVFDWSLYTSYAWTGIPKEGVE